MNDDEEVGDATPYDPTFATSGPRRSTFTPPPSSPRPPAAEEPAHDDDALADALAADLGRLASGTIPVIPELSQLDPSQPEPEQGAAPEPVAETPASPPEPVAETPASPPAAPPVVAAPPAWSTLPAPDPSQAVPLSDEPPVRRSLPDDQLAGWVETAAQGPGGTLEVIEQLETQVRLREEETREFRAWEDRMRSLGTPDALAAVEEARPAFSDLIPAAAPAPAPIVQESASVPDASPLPEASAPADDTASRFAPPWDRAPADEPAPPVEESSTPIVEEPAPQEPRPLPAWEVSAPGSAWAPGPEYDRESEAEPEPEREPETEAEPEPEAEPETGPEPEVVAEPEVRVEPEQAAEFSEETIERPVRTAPVDEDLVIEPTIEPETGPIPEPDEPELTIEPEPEPEPEPEAADLLPPPLIEPPVFGDGPSGAAPRTVPPVFSFDDLLNGVSADGEEPPLHPDPEPLDATPETIFIEPLPVSAGEPVPTDTGSISVTDQAYEEELADDVDETDRFLSALGSESLGPVSVDMSGVALLPPPVAPPSGPISTVRVPENESVLYQEEFDRKPVFSLEESGVEPTPADQRIGRAARLFWLWFAANSSVLSLGLGAAVFAVGMSLRQSIVAVLAGVAVSFIPLGLSTLAGKRSGQPTMVVSRATFGLLGNVVPAVLALVTRVFWGAVLLWLLASSIAIVLAGAELNGALGERQILLLCLAGAFLVAVLVAFAGYPLFARIQLILSCISGVLVVGLIALTAGYIDLGQALSTPDGSWLLTVTGAVLVFSFVGLVWAYSGADLARYQRPGSSGASSMLWATFGTALPSFLLIAYGALLAASDKGIASGFLLSPLDTLALMLPSWYPVPLLAATTLSLLSGITLSLYSGGFALQSIGVRVKRQWSIVIVGVLLGVLALVLTFGVTGGINELFRDAATSLAVPTAAWAGIFAAETMIRNRRYEGQSLVTRGGVYADVRWVNLVALVVISVIGFGLTTASVHWLAWQGFGFSLLGVPLDSDLAATDLGVLVALALGLLVPIVAGIPAIRRQEAARAA